jgi:hypothetical protein
VKKNIIGLRFMFFIRYIFVGVRENSLQVL